MTNEVSKKTTNVTVNLDYPFEWTTDEGKKIVSSITLKRPKGKHLKNLGKDIKFVDLLMLAAKISDHDWVTYSFFEEMDAADCMKVTEVVGDFLDSGQESGETA
jgi:hypothetical protein